jgi:GTPase KRas
LERAIREGNGFALVYSITNRSSFENLTKYRDHILSIKESPEQPPAVPAPTGGKKSTQRHPVAVTSSHMPLVIVGNKEDLSEDREVATQEGRDLADRWRCEFFEVSAKKDTPTDVFLPLVQYLTREISKCH